MGRHAADVMVQLTVRVPRGQQGFWDIVRELHRHKKAWTFQEVIERSNVSDDSVRDFLRRLLKAGYIVEDGRTAKTAFFRLVKDQPEAPRLRRDGSPASETGLGQEQMWRSMKMLSRFDARDLALHSSTAAVPVTLVTAKSYIKRLKRAGYLVEVTPARPGHRAGTGTLATYRLLSAMNTGPLAPQIQATDFVWDPNRLKVMGPEAVKAGKGGGK